MFLRHLEQGECEVHQRQTKCRTGRLMECDWCHREFIIHGSKDAMKRSYCSPKCTRNGNAAAIERAVENVKRFKRINYGKPPAK